MNRHPTIDKWAQKKYDFPAGTEFLIKQETRTGGYCETCFYSEEVMVVYRFDDQGALVEVDSLYTDLASILNEILDGAK
jgi:hypothetical protein